MQLLLCRECEMLQPGTQRVEIKINCVVNCNKNLTPNDCGLFKGWSKSCIWSINTFGADGESHFWHSLIVEVQHFWLALKVINFFSWRFSSEIYCSIILKVNFHVWASRVSHLVFVDTAIKILRSLTEHWEQENERRRGRRGNLMRDLKCRIWLNEKKLKKSRRFVESSPTAEHQPVEAYFSRSPIA